MSTRVNERDTAPVGTTVDVIVVGGGNAAFSAAIAAAERGRTVMMLERASEHEAGGNSFYTAGATRVAHAGLDDLMSVIEPDERHQVTEVPAYSREDYVSDLEKVTKGGNDPELTEVLVDEALDTVRWLHRHGVKFRLMYERQSPGEGSGGGRRTLAGS